MYTEKIKYTDLNGNDGVYTVYFNLNKMEVVTMQWSVPGGVKQLFEQIIEAQDIHQILKWMTEILKKAYGEKSADGKRFIKTDDGWEKFTQSAGYDDWMFGVITNPDKAAEIMRAIMPNIDTLKAPALDKQSPSA